MKYNIDLLFKARQEIFNGWQWYQEEQPGLGEIFEKNVFTKIRSIQASPLHYPSKKRLHYEAKVAKFPYLMVYRINEDEKVITILSVFHTSRHPKRKY